MQTAFLYFLPIRWRSDFLPLRLHFKNIAPVSCSEANSGGANGIEARRARMNCMQRKNTHYAPDWRSEMASARLKLSNARTIAAGERRRQVHRGVFFVAQTVDNR
jgi:hypothetical protein